MSSKSRDSKHFGPNGIDPKRRALLGSVVALTGTTAIGMTVHDGVLGGPSQVVRGQIPFEEGSADAPPGVTGTGYHYFSAEEAAFIEAAVERLIPNDQVGPGAMKAGVPIFLDRQMVAPFGRGEHFYLGGPWPKGTPEQGYQSRFSPAQLYRSAIAAIGKYVTGQYQGATFARLGIDDQEKVLKGLESGEISLEEGVDARTFFEMLLQNTKEGYLSDPIYGGNKDMEAWKMIGFPGAHYDYLEWVTRHGERVPYPSVGFLGRAGWREAGK
jgi:gluconate 2-dehydrogenase gamma chain